MFAFGTSSPDSTIIVGDEHVDVAVDELVHHVLEIALAHLSVPDGDARARNDARNAVRDGLDGLDAIVHEEHLSAAIELARDALLDQAFVPRLDERQHRRSVARRRLHERHVAKPGERQVQRARDRCRRERQHVGLEPELLESLLVLHAEAMLFVDDDQPEVRELHVGAEQTMCADDDVDLLRCRSARTSVCSFGDWNRLSAATRIGKIGETLAERSLMLIGENRRRNEHRDLSLGLHRLERCAHRDFGLAIADVADEQPVHRARASPCRCFTSTVAVR